MITLIIILNVPRQSSVTDTELFVQAESITHWLIEKLKECTLF